MSFASVNNPAIAGPSMPPLAPLAEEPSKPKFKSYKKKFLKLRHRFKERMRENSRLYEGEQHSTRITRRLQEQSDQLLDLLYDLNESTKFPSQLSYDLRSPTPAVSDVPALEPDLGPAEGPDAEGARAALREAKLELDAGQISLAEFRDTQNSLSAIIDASITSSARKRLADISRISHTKLSLVPLSGMPPDLVEDSPPGYLIPAHEDEYLSTLDNTLATAPPESLPLLSRPPRLTEKEREKEAQLHNPVSVYNWLRAHADSKSIPQDVEKEIAISNVNTSESSTKAKPSPKPPSTSATGSTKPSRKRASSALIPKQEPEEELLDEEGYVIAGGSDAHAIKGKRKRENDDAYRPKGGSSKSRKRTKGSSGAAMKKLEPELEEEEEEEDA